MTLKVETCSRSTPSGMSRGRTALCGGLLASATAVAGCFATSAEVRGTDTGTGGTTQSGADTASASDAADTTTTAATSIAGSTGSGSSGTAADTLGTASSSGTSGCEPCFTGRCNDEDRCERFVFVTAVPYSSDLESLGEADALCMVEAIRAGQTGNYRALVAQDPSPVLAFEALQLDIAPQAIFVLADAARTLVSDGPAALRPDLSPAPDLEHAIDRDADGLPVIGAAQACAADVAERVWTGLIPRARGTMAVAGGDCDGWGNTPGGISGGTGRFNAVDVAWAADQDCLCEVGGPLAAHLYCFEVPD